MDADAIVVGGGLSGAVAGLLLAKLGHRVVRMAPEGTAPLRLHVLLPAGAQGLLRSLGLEAGLANAVPVRRSLVQGPPGSESLDPGGPLWLQVCEAELVAAADAEFAKLGGLRRVVGVDRVEGTSVFVGCQELRAPVLLVGVAGLLGEGPRPVWPVARVTVQALRGVPAALVPTGTHELGVHATGWTWALRQDDAVVQVAGTEGLGWREHFGRRWAWDGPEVGASMEAGVWLSRPGPMADVGVLPIGRAAFGVSPLSSQGVAQGLGTAQLAASVANSMIRRPDDEAALRAWYRRSVALRAQRVRQAGAATVAAATAYGTPFWADRAVDVDDGDPVVDQSAHRAAAVAALHGAGRFFDTTAELVEPMGRRELQPNGAVIRWADAVAVEGGLPLPQAEWAQVEAFARGFAEGATLGAVLSGSDAAQRQQARAFSKLVEHGILRLA